MKYVSSRDPDQKQYRFTDVLLEGLAPDGGLYCPLSYPSLSYDQLETWRHLSYSALAYEVISLYVGDSIPALDLKEMIAKTYTSAVFGSESITPLSSVSPHLFIQDLSSGPSLAFKDIAMQFLGHIMSYELERRNQRLTIVGASSGDTVSAAEEAFKDKARLSVVMLTPKTGMSAFQKAQAGSILSDNIFNVSIPAPFDTCQDLVKALNRDASFKESYHIGAVNSINWGRICAQMVYYFYAYFSVCKGPNDCFDVVVPSGNFGNVLAGYIAKRMGLPIRRLIVSTNENKVLDTFFKTGLYVQTPVHVTSSPSMDISKASNIERLFFDVLGRDAALLSQNMQAFESTASLDLKACLPSLLNEYGFVSGSSTHDERQAVIQSVYRNSGIVVDPHTAAALKVAYEYQCDAIPMVCMETAKPAKFEETVQAALGIVPDRPAAFVGLESKPQRFFDLPADVTSLKQFICKTVFQEGMA